MIMMIRHRWQLTTMVAIIFMVAILSIGGASATSSLPAQFGFRLPWQTKSSPMQQQQQQSSLITPPRGGAAALRRRKRVQKGSASNNNSNVNRNMKKKMKKVAKKKMRNNIAGTPMIRSNVGASEAAAKGDTMPSIFRIPSEEKYDRYAAALAVTEGLRRVRDAEIARAEETKGKKTWLGSISSSSSSSQGGLSPQGTLDAANKRAESAFLLQSTKAVKALGMTVTQFNQIGREVINDPALKERVSEQAYLYRMASAVNLDKVPLLDDPSSQKLLQSVEHKKFRVQLFARSIHEIEDLRSDQMEALRQSLQVERFPTGFDLSDPNVQPLLHPEVRRVCEKFPVEAEEIVKRYGLGSDEFNRMLEETKGNPIFRWRVQKYVKKAEEETVKEKKV